MILNILKNVNLFVDGQGYAGQVEEVNLPKLTIKTEEHRDGGMDAPIEIDMGMQKLECSFTTSRIDAGLLRRFGLGPNNLVPLTFRAALESEDGTVVPVVATIRGNVKEIDYGAWKPGEKAKLKPMVTVRYYKLEYDGEVLHEIDIDNMVRIIDGTDRLEAQRTALGI